MGKVQILGVRVRKETQLNFSCKRVAFNQYHSGLLLIVSDTFHMARLVLLHYT